MILVSDGIRTARKFAEVPRGGGVKGQWSCRHRQFLAFSMAIFFGYFTDEASVITWRYAFRRRPFSDPKTHDLE